MTYLLDIIFCSQPGHAFWPDVVSLTDSTLFDVSQHRGHQQITDLYSAGLAARHGGRLATFDAQIPVAALVNVPADVVIVIAR